ncbi:MAG: TonB-dependent receptor [Sphingobium sp.]|nr:TonB-dependent receptor [Sphingobium sp.]
MIGIRKQYCGSVSTLPLIILALCAVPTAAIAQDEKADSAAAKDKAEGDEQSEAIVITGTNISGVKAVGSQAITLGREQILNMGKSSLSEVLQTLPQVQNASGTFNSAANGSSGSSQNGSNTTRGNAVNFRGVGQGATLTLVDGHRVTPNGTATAFTEANQVPMAAIERVEVIADGASAIYGSDAIAGVINYVLRKDFTGLELSGRYTFGAYGNDEYAISGSGGVHWNPDFGAGSVIATFEYGRRLPYVRGLNPRLRADQRPYGGNDGRVNANAASVPINGNIVIPTVGSVTNPNFPQGGAYTYYALPLLAGDAIPTIADLKEVRTGSCVGAATPTCATYPNVIDRTDYEDYLGAQNRYQAAIFFNQEIGGLKIYDEFFWTRTEQFTRTFLSGNGVTNATVSINPGSPYYLNLPNTSRSPFPPFVPASAQPYDVQINLLARTPNGPRFGNQNPDESFNNTFGIKAKLFSDWRGEAYYTFGQDKNCGVCYLRNYVSLETTNGISGAAATNALQQLVNLPLSDPLHVNPYSSNPFTQQQLSYIIGTNSQYAQNWSHDVVAKVDGSVLDLPAGKLKMALGGEYYFGIQKLQNDANRPPNQGPITTPDARARTTRTQYAAFAESYLPLVSSDMNVPLVKALTASAAVRYDHYSDFGSTTNAKVSATWEVSDDLLLRGSWGTSFRAPGLPELNGGVFSLGFGSTGTPGTGVTDIPVQSNGQANVLNFLGNNPNLKAEKGRNWQIGADFTPTFAPGLRLSATYYNLTYRNKMGVSGVPLAIFSGGPFATPALRALYSAYIIPVHNTNVTPTGCTLDPKLEPFTHFLYAANIGFNPRDYCNVNVVVDARGISAANTAQDGLDMTAHYTTRAKIGVFNFDVSASKVFKNVQRTVEGAPLVSVLDTIGNPISWRGRGSLGFMSGPFSATLMGNYVGPYTNDKPITIQGVTQPVSKVGSWMTFDLSLSVSFGRDDDRYSFLKGTRLGVTVTNLFEKEPPVVQSTTSGNSSIDLFTHNAFGRYFQIQLSKAF